MKNVAVRIVPRRGKGKAPRVFSNDSSPIRELDPPLVRKQTSQAVRIEESSAKTISEKFSNSNNKVETKTDHDPNHDLGEKPLVGLENLIEISSVVKGTTVDVYVGPIRYIQAQNPNPSKCMDISSLAAMASLFPISPQTLYFLLMQKCAQLAREMDDLSDRVISLTVEKDCIVAEQDKLHGELDQIKGELQMMLICIRSGTHQTDSPWLDPIEDLGLDPLSPSDEDGDDSDDAKDVQEEKEEDKEG
ncbi:hypothetical protein Q3G72_000245 [Acer saccharum]|nr:hypothetical protein Q3G72_000245 [Acer saccharum]